MSSRPTNPPPTRRPYSGGVRMRATQPPPVPTMAIPNVHGMVNHSLSLLRANELVGGNKRLRDSDEDLLRAAAQEGNVEALRLALQSDPDVNATDETGKTALMLAAAQGHKPCVKALLEHGASRSLQDTDGLTAWMWAARQGNDACVQTLLADDMESLTGVFADGETALMKAVRRGNIRFLNALLNNGAFPNRKNKDGDTALMIAAFRLRADQDKEGLKAVRALEAVRELLKNGASPKIQNDKGTTALMIAAMHESKEGLEAVRELLKKGASPNIQNEDGVTALMFAAVQASTKCLEAMLASKGDPNISMSDGRTALHLASRTVAWLKDDAPVLHSTSINKLYVLIAGGGDVESSILNRDYLNPLNRDNPIMPGDVRWDMVMEYRAWRVILYGLLRTCIRLEEWAQLHVFLDAALQLKWPRFPIERALMQALFRPDVQPAPTKDQVREQMLPNNPDVHDMAEDIGYDVLVQLMEPCIGDTQWSASLTYFRNKWIATQGLVENDVRVTNLYWWRVKGRSSSINLLLPSSSSLSLPAIESCFQSWFTLVDLVRSSNPTVALACLYELAELVFNVKDTLFSSPAERREWVIVRMHIIVSLSTTPSAPGGHQYFTRMLSLIPDAKKPTSPAPPSD